MFETPLPLWMALRYSAVRRNPFARFISWVSVTGLVLGIVVLTVVASVMNGFDAELRGRILSLVPHVVVPGDTLPRAMAEDPAVSASFRFFEGRGMVTRGGAVNPVVVYGLDAEGIRALSALAESMTWGELANLVREPDGIVLGQPLAVHLGLLPGDAVTLVATEPSAGGIRPHLLRFRLVGTFEIGAELDYGLAVVGLDIARMPPLSSTGTMGWRLILDDPLVAPGWSQRWRATYPELGVHDWSRTYGELFQAVALEKVMMFALLLLVVTVAAFNIVSGQMMLVNDKRAEIGILVTMGASRRQVVGTFLIQGLLVAAIGLVVGLAAGVVLAYNITPVVSAVENLFGFHVLAGSYFEQVPSVVLVSDVVIIALLSGGLTFLAAAVPARRALDVNPVEVLHGV